VNNRIERRKSLTTFQRMRWYDRQTQKQDRVANATPKHIKALEAIKPYVRKEPQ